MKTFHSAAWVVAILSGACGSVAMGQTYTWTAGGFSSNWSDPFNWQSAGNSGFPLSGTNTGVLFNSPNATSTTMDLQGGLLLNRLEIGGTSTVLTINGTQPLIFDGMNPRISHFPVSGGSAINTAIFPSIQLQQTLTLQGVFDFNRQVVFQSASTISGNAGLNVRSGVFASNSVNNSFTGEVSIGGDPVTEPDGALWGGNTSGAFGQASLVRVRPLGSIQLFGNSSYTISRPLILEGSGANPFILGVPYALIATGSGVKTWSGPVSLAGDAVIRAGGGATLALTGPVNLAGRTLTVFTSVASTTSEVRISGVISGNGGILRDTAANPTVISTGLSLTGATPNTFTGPVRVNVGVLSIGRDDHLGNAANVVTLSNGGTLNAESIVVAGVDLPVTRSIVLDGGGALTMARVGGGGPRLDVRGTISGTGPLRLQVFNGNRPIALHGNNTFVGNIEVTSAQFEPASDAALGAAGNKVLLNSATLVLPPTVSLSPTRVIEVPGNQFSTGNIQFSGQSTFASTLAGVGQINLQGPATVSLAGTVQVANLLLNSPGVFRASSASSLVSPTGTLTLKGGATLELTGDVAIGAGSTLRIEATSGFNNLSSLDTGAFGLVVNGPMLFSTSLGTPFLRKQGAGALLLNGATTLTGADIQVLGGRVGGVGSFAGRIRMTNSTAVYSPGGVGESALGGNGGNVFGVMTLGTLQAESNSSVLMEIGGTVRGVSYDGVNLGSLFASGSRLRVELLNGFVPSGGSQFQLISATNFFQWFSSVELPTLPGGRQWDTSVLPTTGMLSVIGGPSLIRGDFGGSESSDGSFNTPDGMFDALDIEGFLMALNTENSYLSLNPSLNGLLGDLGDFGGAESSDGSFNTPDGTFDALDIEGFLLALNDPAGYAGIQPPGIGGVSAVPEPGIAMGFLGATALLSRRRR